MSWNHLERHYILWGGILSHRALFYLFFFFSNFSVNHSLSYFMSLSRFRFLLSFSPLLSLSLFFLFRLFLSFVFLLRFHVLPLVLFFPFFLFLPCYLLILFFPQFSFSSHLSLAFFSPPFYLTLLPLFFLSHICSFLHTFSFSFVYPYFCLSPFLSIFRLPSHL